MTSLHAFLRAEAERGRAKLRQRKLKAPRSAPSEREIQKQVVKWLRACGCLVSATENELHGAMDADIDKRMRLAAAAKARGKTPGWPDLTIVTRCNRVVFVEMKAERGRLSERQHEVHAGLRQRGQVVVVGRSIEEVREGLIAEGIWIEAKPRPALGLRSAPP